MDLTELNFRFEVRKFAILTALKKHMPGHMGMYSTTPADKYDDVNLVIVDARIIEKYLNEEAHTEQ